MKVAIMKIGARIKDAPNGSVFTQECLVLASMLMNQNVDVYCVTDVRKSDPPTNRYKIIDYADYFNSAETFDKLIVVGGLMGFYGGRPVNREPDIFKAIMNFPKEGQVYWLQTELTGKLKGYTNAVFNKPWCHCYKHADIIIRPNTVHHIAQFTKFAKYKFYGKISADYFPFEQFPIYLNAGKTLPTRDMSECKYDITYGGGFRFGTREEGFVKYFFGLPDDISCYMFGNIQLEQFTLQGDKKPPLFGEPVKYGEFGKTAQLGWCSVTPPDIHCSKIDWLTCRTYENVINGLVAFIDVSFDANKRIFHDPFLQDFLYISSQDELIEKIRTIKKDPSLFNKIIELQRQDVFYSFDKDKYEKEFLAVLTKDNSWVESKYKNNIPTKQPYDFAAIPEILSKFYCKTHGIVWDEAKYVIDDKNEGKPADLSTYEKIPGFVPTKKDLWTQEDIQVDNMQILEETSTDDSEQIDQSNQQQISKEPEIDEELLIKIKEFVDTIDDKAEIYVLEDL